MNAAPYLAPPPSPPHDPTAWRLDARAGWHAARRDAVLEHPVTGMLTLAPAAGAARSLAEPSGSLGGLRPPANVAVAPDGSIFLLDGAAARLKRFDPCDCRFEAVPCFGGIGGGRQQLAAPAATALVRPTAIIVAGGRLLVCDRGNHRVTVIALHGFVVLEQWRTPTADDLVVPWQPVGIAIDGQGRIYIADAANLAVHRLTRHGDYERSWPALGEVMHIAADCCGRIHAIIDTLPPRVVVLEEDGRVTPTSFLAVEVGGRFAPSPFPVGPDGKMYLADLCIDGAMSSVSKARGITSVPAVFDTTGNPITDAPPLAGPLYASSGTLRTNALDSDLYRCQWHRVVLRGELPAGASVEVATFCAEVALPDAEIDALGDAAWTLGATATAIQGGEWDCLVRSTPGRFLWLRLTLRGTGAATPALGGIEIEFPRISLRRYLPAVFGAEPTSADFTDRFLAIFDCTLRSVERKVDEQACLFDPLSAPAGRERGIDFLTWLGTWIGIAVDRHLPEAKRRLLLKRAASLYDLRGTPYGLWRQLLLYLGMDVDAWGRMESGACRARCAARPSNCAPPPPPRRREPPPLLLEHFKLRRWLFLGTGRLGDTAMLWGMSVVNRTQLDGSGRLDESQLVTTPDPLRDPFHVYAHRFTVFVPASIQRSDALRKGLERLLRTESPAHTTWEIRYVEPRFRIGAQSMIGLDSVIARTPRPGVALDKTTLGSASVLGDTPAHSAASFAVGGARIGGDTRLG